MTHVALGTREAIFIPWFFKSGSDKVVEKTVTLGFGYTGKQQQNTDGGDSLPQRANVR